MKEKRVIMLTALLNIIVASIKIITGIMFLFSTLISDSIQSFIDFFTDITSLIANKIGRRRANKTYPFGYGQVYYLSNLLTGVLLFLIGIYILYQTFTSQDKFIPNMSVLFILIIVLILKGVVISLLQHYGKITKSELLIESYKESRTDFISTCVVIFVLLLSYGEEYIPDGINVDKIGSFFMAIYVFYTSIKMIIANIEGILINDKENDDINDQIMEELEQFKELKFKKVKIIKMSNYYSVFLQIDVNDNIKIKDFLALEKRIKYQLKSSNRLIRFIDVEPM